MLGIEERRCNNPEDGMTNDGWTEVLYQRTLSEHLDCKHLNQREQCTLFRSKKEYSQTRLSKVIYGLKKALYYGTLRAPLLFWKVDRYTREGWGFVVNPYDWCVKQCTILWHVDDLKISHVATVVETSIISQLGAEFANEAPLTLTLTLTIRRGKLHNYLGMTIDFLIPRKVRFFMVDYIKSMLEDVPADMSGMGVITPAPTHLFDINENEKTLNEELAEIFHHNVAKMLFLCKRARPADIQTAISCLCTRVRESA
eukprot:scaffold38838_cov56-Attheya_sp.AAC.2